MLVENGGDCLRGSMILALVGGNGDDDGTMRWLSMVKVGSIKKVPMVADSDEKDGDWIIT